MALTKKDISSFKHILHEELLTALGCTEPIAIAYCAAKAREVLGQMPQKITVSCSGNIIKNAKSVTVPTTVDLKGIEAAAIIGAVGGDTSLGLEVLTSVTPDDLTTAKELIAKDICNVLHLQTPAKLHIIVSCEAGEETATVEILHTHTDIVKTTKNNAVVFEKEHDPAEYSSDGTDRSCLTLAKIYEFVELQDFEGITDLLNHAVISNMEISNEGLRNSWGAEVGQTIRARGDDVRTRAISAAAAGSDARMSGCELGVVINSGSGNQGITVTVPVVVYSQHLCSSRQKMFQALAMSNLISIYLKSKIGRLSAFCGAVSAGCAAACGIAYLEDATFDLICQIIVNTLGNVGGIVCDGAKASCAAKIASSVDAGLIGYEMALRNRGFRAGEGLVKETIEHSIDSFCRMARVGMETTDDEILKIMVDC